MTITALAVVFLLLLLLAAVFGYRVLSKKAASLSGNADEQCSICRNRFAREDMLERQIGDFAVRYFCEECIGKLYAEMSTRRGAGSSL